MNKKEREGKWRRGSQFAMPLDQAVRRVLRGVRSPDDLTWLAEYCSGAANENYAIISIS